MRSLRTTRPAQDSAPTVDDAGCVAAIAGQSGSILWSRGGRVVQRRTRQVDFSPGGRWDEPHLDTDAL
ncbi:hypothetical protein SY2F82_11790 [Streptomyces sp. Y2F8-2]|nr:hypothetical protein SY2F82_11790 [Streptomyces sp. Y2F8-2]